MDSSSSLTWYCTATRISTKTLSLVLVSQETSICWRRIDTVAAGNSQKHGITTFRPGFAILVNLPNCSISATVPVFTVTQGMIPHDIGGG